MPVLVNCPHCQMQVNVPDALLGQTVRCAACGGTFTASAPIPVVGVAAAPGGDGGAFGFVDKPGNEVPHRGVKVLLFGIFSVPLGFGALGFCLLPGLWSGHPTLGQAVIAFAVLAVSTILLLLCWGLGGAALSMGHADLT